MATRQQKMKVGGFMLVSAVLIVYGLVYVAGYRQTSTTEYWIEFEESVLGLSKGNMVEYKGVPVGTVLEIYVEDNNKVRVEIEIIEGRVTLREGVTAKLVIYSLATGTMYVSLAGGEPDSPLLVEGSQIPTEPSIVEAMRQQVENSLDNFNSILEKLNRGLEGLEEGQLARVITESEQLIMDGQSFLAEAKSSLNSLTGNAEGGFDDIRGLAADLRTLSQQAGDLIGTIQEKAKPLDMGKMQTELDRVLTNMGTLTEKLNTTVEKLDDTSDSVMHEADNIEHNLRQGLTTLEESLEAVRELADYLKQDPGSLVRGRGTPRRQP